MILSILHYNYLLNHVIKSTHIYIHIHIYIAFIKKIILLHNKYLIIMYKFKKLLFSLLLTGLITLCTTSQSKAQFITEWVTTTSTIQIPTTGSGYSYSIVWTNLTNSGVGDGSASGLTSAYTITGLANGDTYQLSITGAFPRMWFTGYSSERPKIRKVTQWGTNPWAYLNNTFWDCINLDVTASDAPVLTSLVNNSLSYMFRGCTSLVGTSAFNSWDVSNIVNLSYMFNAASNFNADITGWSTSNVTTMRSMFYGAASFNQDISGWDVSNVTDMGVMFRDASAFDQNLGSWDLSSLTDAVQMFFGGSPGISCANFGRTIRGWDLNPATPNSVPLGVLGRSIPSDIKTANLDHLTAPIGSGGKGWTLGGTPTLCAALPLTLLNFSTFIVSNTNNVQLSWELANSNEMQKIELLKSKDGGNWSTITTYNNSNQNTFTYTDLQVNNTSYYRLKMIDLDGNESYSSTEIVNIVNKNNNDILLFPNPSNGVFTVQNALNRKYSVLGVNGQIVKQGTFSSNQANLDLGQVSNGVYILRLDDGSHQQISICK